MRLTARCAAARRAPLLLAALVATACTSEAATAPVETTPVTTSSTAEPTTVFPTSVPSTSITPFPTSSDVALPTTPMFDPSYLDTPIGTCDTITDGAIGYRNETGTIAERYEQIGESAQGRPIWAEHWGTSDGPQVLVLGQVHGDECAPAWFVRAIRERPPTTFGIWLVATVNPDGLAAHTRRTADDIDPNRDGFRLETPEARAVMAATERFRPALTVHVHSPYQWIGAHNGGLATQAAQAMSDAVGWGPIPNAGRVGRDDLAFLWEGQERVIPGHPSVLIEFPAVAEAESPAPPDPAQKDVATVAVVADLAVTMRDALYTVMSAQ